MRPDVLDRGLHAVRHERRAVAVIAERRARVHRSGLAGCLRQPAGGPEPRPAPQGDVVSAVLACTRTGRASFLRHGKPPQALTAF
mmetsp:Transcript_32087/g.74467  ORF Transcript_32087/g.74467 Transcript_32087/m.74467 type:complete len:85 (-) Transcript_32087:121-375(-)